MQADNALKWACNMTLQESDGVKESCNEEEQTNGVTSLPAEPLLALHRFGKAGCLQQGAILRGELWLLPALVERDETP